MSIFSACRVGPASSRRRTHRQLLISPVSEIQLPRARPLRLPQFSEGNKTWIREDDPGERETSDRCRFNAGPASRTLARHWTGIGRLQGSGGSRQNVNLFKRKWPAIKGNDWFNFQAVSGVAAQDVSCRQILRDLHNQCTELLTIVYCLLSIVEIFTTKVFYCTLESRRAPFDILVKSNEIRASGPDRSRWTCAISTPLGAFT